MRRPLPPSRRRRIAKWTGLVVCVVILGMWVVSLAGTSLYYGEGYGFGLSYGAVWAHRNMYLPKWAWVSSPSPLTLGGLPDFHVRRHQYGFYVPFWLLLTLAAIPTAVLWHRDRRMVKPGYCHQCGYDLRASKKTCPECGAAVPTQETTA